MKTSVPNNIKNCFCDIYFRLLLMIGDKINIMKYSVKNHHAFVDIGKMCISSEILNEFQIIYLSNIKHFIYAKFYSIKSRY